MTRLIALLAVLVLTAGTLLAGNVIVVKHASGGGCSKANVLFWWSLEATDFSGAANGTTDYSAGDDIAQLYNSAAVDTGSPKIGTNALTAPASTANSFSEFSVSGDDIADHSAGRVGFWMKWGSSGGTRPADGVDINIFELSVDTTNKLLFTLYSYDTDGGYQVDVAYQYSTTYEAEDFTASSAVFEGTWYYIEVEWDASQTAGSDVLKLYVDGALVAGSSTETMTDWGASATYVRLGWQSTTTTDRPTYFDQLIITSDHTKSLYGCRTIGDYPE